MAKTLNTTISKPAAFPRHAVSSDSWSKNQLLSLFAHADWVSRQPRANLARLAPHGIVGLLFYQNSTRTLISFQAASCLIGSGYVGFADAKTTRAGDFFQETLEDTAAVLSCYADLLVLRHVDDDAAERAAAAASVPVINAGTGESDHPTQGMLEAWMMTKILGDIAGRRIGLVGDPGCRAIRAIVTVVAKFSPAEFVFLMPEHASLDAGQLDELGNAGVRTRMAASAAEMLQHADAISMIPFELPDFHVAAAPSDRAGALDGRFVFDRKLIESAGRNVSILHTGPRGGELPADADALPGVRYFDGVRSGMFLRAALMNTLLETSSFRSPAGDS